MWDKDVGRLRTVVKFMMALIIGIVGIDLWSLLLGPLILAPWNIRFGQGLNIAAMLIFLLAMRVSLVLMGLIQGSRDLHRVMMSMMKESNDAAKEE